MAAGLGRDPGLLHAQPEPGAPRNERKNYVLEMLPYPSGTLHVGQVRNYTQGDVLAHFHRRNGKRRHAADGLRLVRPERGERGDPGRRSSARHRPRNIERIRRQMKRMGWAIDWDREVATHEPEYYRWTQWLFLQFLKAGQALRKEAPVKWCPKDQTVLANEQVIDGRCERCGTEVEAKMLEQWFFRYTTYADALLDEMELLESWPERVLAMQRNWIGRSEGAEMPVPCRGARPRHPGLHDARRHAVRRDVLRARARAPARRRSSWRGRRTASEILDYVRRTAAPAEERPRTRRRTASSPASSRRIRSTARACRSGSPTTC